MASRTIFPTPEDAPFPIQTSLYGASKLAGEGLIQAYCEGFGFQGYIFRFVSMLGERYTHGHVFDFYKKLSDDPSRLHVLGDGRQRKSYIYVQDCIDAMLLAIRACQGQGERLNLGTDEYSRVNDSIGWISERLGRQARSSTYAGGERGWIGDSPFIFARHQAHSLAWLEADADHPRGRVAHGRLARCQQLGVRAAAHEARVLRPVASRHGDRRLHGCGRNSDGRRSIDDAERIAGLRAASRRCTSRASLSWCGAGLAAGTLASRTDIAAVADADVVWVCHDTPVDDEDRADIDAVHAPRRRLFRSPEGRRRGAGVGAASGRLGRRAGAGFRRAQAGRRAVSFACSPENLRLGQAIEVFQNPGRIVVGRARPARAARPRSRCCDHFCDNLIWMSVESAEMVKHALNAFLAVSVTFTNEIATVCERVGADAAEVEKGLAVRPAHRPARLCHGRSCVRGRHAGARRQFLAQSRARAST